MILAEYGNSDITALIRKKICQEESRKPYVSPSTAFFLTETIFAAFFLTISVSIIDARLLANEFFDYISILNLFTNT